MNFWSRKFIGISGVILLLALLWLVVLDRGKISVSLEAPFTLDAKGFRVFSCEKNDCIVKIPSGEREFCVEKDEYFPQCENLFIPLWKEISWHPTLKKIPKILSLPKEPQAEVIEEKKTPSPKIPEDFKNLPHTTTPFRRFFVFQPETGDLLFFESSEKSSVISHFSHIKKGENLRLFSLKEKILAQLGGEIFFIDPEMRQKFRLFSGIDPEIKIFGDAFLLRDEGRNLLFSGSEMRAQDFPIAAELSKIVRCENDFFAFLDGEFFRIFSKNLLSEKIVKAQIFDDFLLKCGETPNSLRILFVNGEEKELAF